MDDLSQTLAAQLPAAQHDVDVLLALEALSRANPELACHAILGFISSASVLQIHLARKALVSLAEQVPAILVAATLDDQPAVADAAKHALVSRPSNGALPFLLRLGKSKSAEEVATAVRLMGRVSSPDVRAPLFKALGHRSVTVRIDAADSIRKHADSSWLPELMEAIRTLRLEEFEKKKDFSEIINSLCSTFVAKASTANAELLLTALQDSDAVVRKACINALGGMNEAAAVLPLIALLEQPNRGVRFKTGDPSVLSLRLDIVTALGRLGDARAIGPLLQTGVKVSAPALAQLNAQEAVPALIAALEEATVPRDASDLAEVLRQLAGPGEQQWPRVALQSASLTVRRAAALALYDTAPAEAAEHLLDILPQLESGAAIGVAKALAQLGLAEGLQGLARTLEDDPLHWNASAVAAACESLSGPEVRALLLGLLPGIRNEYVHVVCNALVAQGTEVLPALISAAQDANSDIQHRYILALSMFHDPDCAEFLAPLLLGNKPLGDAAMLALGRTPSAQASVALGAALQRADTPKDERCIAEVLALVATREAIPDLLRTLASGYAVEETLEALGRIADPSAVPVLIEQLGNAKPQRRKAAAAALAQIGDQGATQALLELLLKETDLDVVLVALPALLQVSRAQDAWVRDGLAAPGTRTYWLASAKQLDEAHRNTTSVE
ncbi:HEAT repeat domain-containing protein [Chitinimonas naiadis]